MNGLNITTLFQNLDILIRDCGDIDPITGCIQDCMNASLYQQHQMESASELSQPTALINSRTQSFGYTLI